ncbi:hypothetical protein ILUMI_06756 [Ignelater luminosus]|uniref:Uncharacterized protein n=1 Tax=Ignelater luminosus TaxID=2038154 RepID=A0A8K0D4Q1_IGNLU|nr:hypothetical protein ILUMI_06756 [Ignelater luminosus]
MFAITTIMPSFLWGQDLFWSFFMVCIVRLCLTLNITWTVNSVAHIWGNKPYNKYISPCENVIVSFAAFGEGWHNYHHTFPWDYRTGELGNFNFTTAFLELCNKVGLAYDFKIPSEELIKKTIENKGDGTHKVREVVKEYLEY